MRRQWISTRPLCPHLPQCVAKWCVLSSLPSLSLRSLFALPPLSLLSPSYSLTHSFSRVCVCVGAPLSPSLSRELALTLFLHLLVSTCVCMCVRACLRVIDVCVCVCVKGRALSSHISGQQTSFHTHVCMPEHRDTRVHKYAVLGSAAQTLTRTRTNTLPLFILTHTYLLTYRHQAT